MQMNHPSPAFLPDCGHFESFCPTVRQNIEPCGEFARIAQKSRSLKLKDKPTKYSLFLVSLQKGILLAKTLLHPL